MKVKYSVVSDSLQPHGLQPTRLLRPWDFPGKSTGVGCHCLLLLSSKLDITSLQTTSRLWTFLCYALCLPWTSLVAQMVKNLPAMRETWVQSLDWEDPLEKEMATHSSTLAWRIPMDRAWRATVCGVAKSRTQQSNFFFHFMSTVEYEYNVYRLKIGIYTFHEVN